MEDILGGLSSLKFALVVVLLIALACVAGSVIPQGGSQVSAYLARRPDSLRAMEALTRLGLTRVYYSWWFVGLLFLFAASLAACTARRYATLRRAPKAARLRLIGSFVTHVSLLLVLIGGVVRVLWGQKGVMQLHEGDVSRRVEGSDTPIVLPFSVRLVKFELEHHDEPGSAASADLAPGSAPKLHVIWEEKQWEAEFPIDLNVPHPVGEPVGQEAPYTVSVLRYLPDFIMSSGEAKSRSDNPVNPALFVSVTGGGVTRTQWVFARFPDFSEHGGAAAMPLKFRFEMAQAPLSRGRPAAIKAFKSTVEIIEDGSVIDTRVIAVNSPYSHKGYTFYQMSYNPNDLSWSVLQVVKDPGVPIVYGGFILMMAGLTLVFCVGPFPGSQGMKKEGAHDTAV